MTAQIGKIAICSALLMLGLALFPAAFAQEQWSDDSVMSGESPEYRMDSPLLERLRQAVDGGEDPTVAESILNQDTQTLPEAGDEPAAPFVDDDM